jgi:hypothetical protein
MLSQIDVQRVRVSFKSLGPGTESRSKARSHRRSPINVFRMWSRTWPGSQKLKGMCRKTPVGNRCSTGRTCAMHSTHPTPGGRRKRSIAQGSNPSSAPPGRQRMSAEAHGLRSQERPPPAAALADPFRGRGCPNHRCVGSSGQWKRGAARHDPLALRAMIGADGDSDRSHWRASRQCQPAKWAGGKGSRGKGGGTEGRRASGPSIYQSDGRVPSTNG